MKRKGHKHKEYISILMISDTGQGNRQFHISRTAFKILVAFVVLILAGVCASGWIFSPKDSAEEQENLYEQLADAQKTVKRLEEEKAALEADNALLRQENESAAQNSTESEAPNSAEDEDEDADIPRRYPASGRSTVLSSFSEETPYLSISVEAGGTIVAAGSGMVVQVSSDDTYPVIIEIEHKKNYRTRYMFRSVVEISAAEGAQVEAGDVLLAIDAENMQLDYQITYEDNPIDPLTVIEAKG